MVTQQALILLRLGVQAYGNNLNIHYNYKSYINSIINYNKIQTKIDDYYNINYKKFNFKVQDSFIIRINRFF